MSKKVSFRIFDPPMNYQDALERMGGDEALLEELLDLNLKDFEAKYIRIQNAIKQENFKQMEELGHSLKGASAILSLGPLEKISSDLETAGRERDLRKTEEIPLLLAQEIRRLKDYLTRKAGRAPEAQIGESTSSHLP